jgi:hypothetical protein
MYSQNPPHFNTVFLITLFAGFLPGQGVETGTERSASTKCGG